MSSNIDNLVDQIVFISKFRTDSYDLVSNIYKTCQEITQKLTPILRDLREEQRETKRNDLRNTTTDVAKYAKEKYYKNR